MKDSLLRPRSAVEIIDAAFALYRANFVTLAVIALAVLGPFKIIATLVGGTTGSVIELLSGLLTPIVVGASLAVVSDAMHDRPISVGSAFGQIADRWSTLITTAFAQGILVFLAALLLLIPGVLVFCWTFAAPAVVVVERESSVTAAISRSRQLAKGYFWHVFGTLALSWLVVIVLLVALAIGVGLLSKFIGFSDEITGFLASWAFTLMVPIAALANAILYFDLRVRSEAYDIEHMAATVAGPTGGPTAKV